MDNMLRKKLIEAGIDVDMTQALLSRVNTPGDDKSVKQMQVSGFPPQNHPRIIDIRNSIEITVSRERLESLLDMTPSNAVFRDRLLKQGKKEISLGKEDLRLIGTALFSTYAYGILNGGSASSYCDVKKNIRLSAPLFDLLNGEFHNIKRLCQSMPKSLTPAYITRDGAPGSSFLELKVRALLLRTLESRKVNSDKKSIGFFQMTSRSTDAPVREFFESIADAPLIRDISNDENFDFFSPDTAVQPLLAALTSKREEEERKIFFTQDGNPLPMPGGHGQCFVTLKGIFQKLQREGRRYISIGNVDNLGYTPDPVSIALLALRGDDALFHFSYKTPVDHKGGVLVIDEKEHLNCVDIGAGISAEMVESRERRGKPTLFNCAVGYFDLNSLLEKIDRIIETLPLRVTEQEKDIGSYAQGEQVTWEVIGLLDRITVAGVEKKRRFLASKLLIENFVNSGYALDRYPTECKELKEVGELLSQGLSTILREDYALSVS